MGKLNLAIPGTGTLALTGSGEYLPGMDDVDRFLMAQLAEPARVVCLPTAAGTEGTARVRYWMELGVQHFQDLGAQAADALPVIDRVSAENAAYAERVLQANFVYLSGGKPPYLFDTLRGTAVWQAVEEVVRRGGVVAGCSAGAMIFGERVLSGPGRLLPFDGFGWVKGAYIIPHFDEMPGALADAAGLLLRGLRMVGVEGYTALVAGGQGVCVRGKGAVELRLDGTKERIVQAAGWW